MSSHRCYHVPGVGRVQTDGRPPSPRDLEALRKLGELVRSGPPVGPSSADPIAPADRQAMPATFRAPATVEPPLRAVARKDAPAPENPRP